MKPRKPLLRSLKPIKRAWLKKTPGRKSKVSRAVIRGFKNKYFGKGLVERCQWCGGDLNINECHAHHKIKRSLGGKDVEENLVVLHERCHTEIHVDYAKLKMVKASSANMLNREMILESVPAAQIEGMADANAK